jgi:hypothetical protein
MAATSYPQAPVPEPAEDKRLSVPGMLAGEWVRDTLLRISMSSPRSRQVALGPSDMGQPCLRRSSYKLLRTSPVNLTDPLLMLLGNSFHEYVSAALGDDDRYLLEYPVEYRGVLGTVDLYDRYRRRVIDWKTTKQRSISRYVSGGPPSQYVVQASIYAAGLIAEGYPVDEIALVFLPRDGTLSDLWVSVTPPDLQAADEHISRVEQLKLDLMAGATPGEVDPTPSPLCSYCPYHRPQSTDLTLACPGSDKR